MVAKYSQQFIACSLKNQRASPLVEGLHKASLLRACLLLEQPLHLGQSALPEQHANLLEPSATQLLIRLAELAHS